MGSRRQRRCGLLALALSAAAAAYGCAAPNPIVSLAPPAKAPVSDSYPDQLRRWTRFGRIIKQLDTPLKVHATLFAPEFASAYGLEMPAPAAI